MQEMLHIFFSVIPSISMLFFFPKAVGLFKKKKSKIAIELNHMHWNVLSFPTVN